jgi:Tetracyclin repressor-like, C-terminal domain
VAVLSLFGMMNWIYTWYNPHVDGDAKTLAREIGDVFLGGIYATSAPRSE